MPINEVGVIFHQPHLFQIIITTHTKRAHQYE